MSYDIEKAVEDWVLSLSRSEIDRYLSRMELRRQGSLFQLCDRLNKWVLGIYVPQNFQEPADRDEAIARRTALREDLLRRIVTEEDGTFVQTSVWDVHPLEVVVKSEEILEILRKTTAEAAFTPQQPQYSKSPENVQHQADDDLEEILATHQNNVDNSDAEGGRGQSGGSHPRLANNETQTDEDNNGEEHAQGEDMLRLLSSAGTEFQVPRDVGMLLAELITKVRSLEDRLTNHQRQVA